MKKSPIIYMQNLLNCDEERKINDTKIVLNSVNGDLCASGTHSSLNSFKNKKIKKIYRVIIKYPLRAKATN